MARGLRSGVFAIVFVCVLAGCAGTPIDWNKARTVQPGMPASELVSIMGKPYSVRSSATGELWVWVYVDAGFGTKTYSVEMADGKVSKAPPIPASFK